MSETICSKCKIEYHPNLIDNGKCVFCIIFET